MDWAKAKTILIAVFLAINIFLAYMILGANYGNRGLVDSERIKQVTNYLEEKNITITGQVPLRKSNMPPITVKYKLFNTEDIAGRLFASGKNSIETSEGSEIKLAEKDIEVSIKYNRELNYINKGIKPAAEINEKMCSKNIKEFLNRLGLKDDASIRSAESLEGYKRFIYKQAYKGATIYNSIMEFYVNDAGVYKARIVWFETVKQAGKKSDVVSPVVALLSLPEYYKESALENRKVLSVEQGYYFGTGASNQVDTSKVEEGTAFPVWRITTDRDIICINAYNEKIEGVERRQ